MKYYVLVVWGDLDPEVFGPYSSEEERNRQAKALYKEHGDRNGYYSLDCEADCAPIVGSWSGAFFDE
jgi:hypothetical protein